MENTQEKTVHFLSLGCPKNLVDSEMMLGDLLDKGFRVEEDPSQAETIVVNTCSFIEDARKESVDSILEMTKFKKSGSLKNLVVTGCLPQRYKQDLVESFPEVDVFIGSGGFQNLSEILKTPYETNTQGERKAKTFFHLPTYLQEETTLRKNSQPQHRAYLKISEGCKKRCAFCAIPHIRGNLQSRFMKDILKEAQGLVAGGVKELIIISHDFTDYGWDLKRQNISQGESPYELLKLLSEESGAEWIRVLYLYPDGIDEKMVSLFKEKKNLVKYFDMPLQHINNEVLKRMNRRMTKDHILKVLKNIREEIPEAVIRTQFIVGFPGETEEQFQELLEFVKEQKFHNVGCFTYSIEENTKAGTLPDQIEESVKQTRHNKLMELQKPLSKERQEEFLGKVIPVLVEGYSEETELLLKGRHSQQAPDIDGITYINSGQANIGDLIHVKVTDAHDYDLLGEKH